MRAPLVSVIVPSLGRHEPLLDSVRDLLDQDHEALEVVVVDQNEAWPAPLEPRRAALRSDPRVRWVERFPVGVVRARNHAVSIARGELLLFVDDDVWIPDRAFVRRHVEAHADAEVACVCGRELKLYQVDRDAKQPLPRAAGDAPGLPQPKSPLGQLIAFDRSRPEPAELAVFSTCNGSIKREAFERVGGFDAGFAGASYGDDADLALRMRALGMRIVYDPSAWLVHLVAPAGGLRLSDPRNRFSERDRCLSGLIVLFRHAGIEDAWPILYGWVLRRSVLLRHNVMRPWRQPVVLLGLLQATAIAWRVARNDPQGTAP